MRLDLLNINSNDFNFIRVIDEALKYESFDESIRAKFQHIIMGNVAMPLAQRLAICQIAEKISLKRGDAVSIFEGIMKVLTSTWADVGINEQEETEAPPALAPADRKQLLEDVIMPLFRAAVANEIDRLSGVLDIVTELPANWHLPIEEEVENENP